jgi:hypothetical protein
VPDTESEKSMELKLMIIIIVAAFAVIFFAARHQELNRGRDSYNLKDFILELLNHTGDGRNLKR